MAKRRIPGTFSVEQSHSGTPLIRGTATVEGTRRRKPQTLPSTAAANAMAEALTEAARLGDYAWFSDPSSNPPAYLDGSIDGLQVTLAPSPSPPRQPHQDALATTNVSRRAPVSDSRTEPPKE